MEINDIHALNLDMEQFKTIQKQLQTKIIPKNNFQKNDIKRCAGVDVAYWKRRGKEWGVCSIIVVEYKTRAAIEKVYSIGEITSPYVPGFLGLRELPLVIKTARKLSSKPDIFMFDGNGYLHPQHMGIATHASFFLQKPTIGIAKNYHRIHDVDFIMPVNQPGSYENIIIEDDLYGRVLRTHKNVKPIFISIGNDIDIQTSTEITLHLIGEESRLPVPVRLADIEAKRIKQQVKKTY